MLIVGSKSEDEHLRNLLSKTYQQDLKKSQKNDVVASVQEWLKKQPHLPQLTDEEVAVFLHSCYYRAEKAKETIDNYFTFRMHAPELFKNRDPKKSLASVFETAYFLLMPEECKSNEGNIVVILRLRDTDPAHANFPLEAKACLALLDFLIARFPFSNGLEVIMDMEGLTLTHILKLDLSILRKFMNYVQEALPIRLKAVHILNTFPLIHQIMAIMKPLIKADLFALLHFHTTADFNSFCEKYVRQDNLPADYGGKQDKMDTIQEQVFNDFMLARDWMKELEEYKLEKLLLKYEQRNLMLREKEANVRTRVEMMEATMPILLAWNMYQNCIEEKQSDDSQTTEYPIWFSEQRSCDLKAESENDLQKRKEELDRLIKEIRRREKLDRERNDGSTSSEDSQ